MLRKIIPYLLLALLLLLSAGCGAKKERETAAGDEEKTLTGTLDEVKDFMFVVTDESGDSYALAFSGEKPEGLEDQEIGSQVKVTYTGKLSVVDPFEGEILSVEAGE